MVNSALIRVESFLQRVEINWCIVVYLTDKAWAWIEAHEDRFLIRRPAKREVSLDEDIPF